VTHCGTIIWLDESFCFLSRSCPSGSVIQRIAGSGRGHTHLRGGEGRCLPERCRAPQFGSTPLRCAAIRGHASVVEKLLAAGADWAAAAADGSTPRSSAHGAALAIFVAAEEEAQRLRSIAFAMGMHERLGAASVVRGLDPELLRMVVEHVYPPVDNVLEAEGEINSDSDSEVDDDSEVDEEGESDEEEGDGEEEGEGDEEEGGSSEEEG